MKFTENGEEQAAHTRKGDAAHLKAHELEALAFEHVRTAAISLRDEAA